jgi:hypothetical protein
MLPACGGSEPAAQPTVTVTAAPAPSAQGATVEDTPDSSPTKAAANVRQGIVPNVVGKDHQFAQDTMQAAGFYNLSEEDATGAGRTIVLDRNWIVVTQQPRAGTRASPDTTIILRSKKKGE